MPDFRAAEKTFHLLAQVAGRAGRGQSLGAVFIQTLCPDHYAIALAKRQDYRAFFEHEIGLREDLRYPPFTRLVELTGLGPERPALHTAMLQVEKHLREVLARAGQLTVLGPAPSPIPRLRGRYREQLLVKGNLSEDAKRGLLQYLADAARAAPGVEFQVDVDPANML